MTLPVAEVDGQPFGLAAGIYRDTTTSIQGNIAQLRKLGATLRGDPGIMRFLQVEPTSQTYVAWNPQPDLSTFALTLPGGQTLEFAGLTSLTKVEVNVPQNAIKIEAAASREQLSRVARHVNLSGFSRIPTVEVNGVEMTGKSADADTSVSVISVPITIEAP
jgi:hypothetical protein